MNLNADLCKHIVNPSYIVPLLDHLADSRISNAIDRSQIAMKHWLRQCALSAKHIACLCVLGAVHDPRNPMPAQQDRQAQDNARRPPDSVERYRADMMCLALWGMNSGDLRVQMPGDDLRFIRFALAGALDYRRHT